MEQNRSINPGVSRPIEAYQSTGFNITSSPFPITNNEIKVAEQIPITTQSSAALSSPILQRRRIDQILAPNIPFDNALDLNGQNCPYSSNQYKKNNHQLRSDVKQNSIQTTPTKSKSVPTSATPMRPKTTCGRPRKRPLEAQTLVEAFGKLTRTEIAALDTTAWSKKLPDNTRNVWSITCANLKLKDNDKNKKWLAHVWQSNIWLVADEVRKNVSNPVNDVNIIQINTVPISINHDIPIHSPIQKETECERVLDNITDIVSIWTETATTTEDLTIYQTDPDPTNYQVHQIIDDVLIDVNKMEATHETDPDPANYQVHQIIDEILTDVNKMEISPVKNQNTMNQIMQLSVVQNLTPQFAINSPSEEVHSDEPIPPAYGTSEYETMRDQLHMEHQRLAKMDYYTVPDESTLFPYINSMTTYEQSEETMDDQHDIAAFNQNSVRNMKDNQEQQKHENSQGGKQCVHKIAERGATSIPSEHRHLVDVLLNRPTTAGKYEDSVPSEPVSLHIDISDLNHFKRLQTEEAILKKKVPSSKTSPTRKRDTEWIILFQKYVDQVNDSCVFMYKNHHFSTAKSTKPANDKQFLISADAACSFSECRCSFHAIIYSNCELIIQFKGYIRHSPSEQRSRPYRGTMRQSIAEKLTTGYTPDQLRLKKFGDLTENNRKFGNLNLVGSSPHVFRKIRSEAKTSLMLDKDLPTSLQKIKEEQIKQIDGKSIPGYLQTISISPLRLVCFTEAGLILWDKVVDKLPLSWDATGGIVMSKGKRVFYYELTVANISTRPVTTKNLSGPSFPVTSMLSTSHTTMDLVQWLQDFEAAYRKLFGFKKPFPRPSIIHSDGAIVFQMAALRFFNGDTTLSVYLKRCWSIINKTATKEDLTKTIVHSCLAHFIKSVKRQAIKYYPKLKVPFALWLMSLLLNSNTIQEMGGIWEHICTVLLSPTSNSSYSVSISCLSNAADNINKDPNKDNLVTKNVKVDSKGVCQYPITFDQIIDETQLDDGDIEDTISEENALSESESPFRDYFTNIYSDKLKNCAIFESEEFKKYNENPYYNPTYLTQILSLYLRTAPIWSNLMMGNLARYGYPDVEPIEHCGCHNSRTTGISESRLKVVKHTVLGGEVSSRIDQVVQKLGSTIRQTEINYCSHYLLNLTRNRTVRAKKLLAEEPWNKRGPPPPTTTSIYSEKPKVSLIDRAIKFVKRSPNVNNPPVESTNVDIIQSTPHPMTSEQQLCWLNSSIQLVLSNNSLIEAMMKSPFFISTSAKPNDNKVAITLDAEDDNTDIFDGYTKIDECNIKYLLDILKSSTKKPFGLLTTHKYIEDLRQYGPKAYSYHTQEHVPFIQPLGQLSSIIDYLSNVLFNSISKLIDIRTIWNSFLLCSQCHAENTSVIQNFPWLTLSLTDCEGLLLPTVALKNYFSINNYNTKTCSSCGTASDQNQYVKELLQLPDTLFFSFSSPERHKKDSNNDIKPVEVFIENHLNVSAFASSELVCYPSYFKYQLKSVLVKTEDTQANRHYYTFAKYNEQFYRCNDELIEPVDKSVIFDRKYSSSAAMYIRETQNKVNFTEIISQILLETENFNLPTSVINTHIRMIFDAAVEYVARYTKLLSWSYGAVYTCVQCREKNYVFGNDCILFSNEKHISKYVEISLDDTLLQTKLVPKIRCTTLCDNGTIPQNARYSILEIPQFVFVTVKTNSIKKNINTATTTTENYKNNVHDQIYIKCDLTKCSFRYNLHSFIVVTKDEASLIIKPQIDNKYAVYNNDTKQYELLAGYQFDDFITASATNIVFCYKTNDTVVPDPILKPTTLDMDKWQVNSNLNQTILTENLNTYMSSFVEPLKIHRYHLKSSDIQQIIKPNSTLTDTQVNAHIHVTTTLSKGILLFDSVQFTHYSRRGFRKSSEILDKQWFTNNVVLVPIHHSPHWILFVIDIKKQTIILFDSLPSNSTPYEKYKNTIVQLLKTHYFYTKKSNLDFNEWQFISDFKGWKQDDATSCGIHCAMFARSYVTSTKYPSINKKNINAFRLQYALHLLEQNNT